MTLPPSKNLRLNSPKPEIKTGLLKCIPLKNMKEKNGKLQQSLDTLVIEMDQLVLGEIWSSRVLAEFKAKEEAPRDVHSVGKRVTSNVDARSHNVLLSLIPSPQSESVCGSLLAKKLLEIAGVSGWSVAGSDNTSTTVRTVETALPKMIWFLLLIQSIFLVKNNLSVRRVWVRKANVWKSSLRCFRFHGFDPASSVGNFMAFGGGSRREPIWR